MQAAVILFCLLTTSLYLFASAAPVDAVARKATMAEIAETVIPEGVMLRATDGAPGALYIGDGSTPGGVRVGDGNTGWVEGTALSQELNTGGHAINMGGWTLLTLGGWAAMSGGDASTDSNGVFRLSMNGGIFMEALSSRSLVRLTRFAWVPPYFELDTESGEAEPFIEQSTNLVSGTWLPATVVSVVTNGATRNHRIAPNTCAFFRATISAAATSEVNFTGALKENGARVITGVTVADGAATGVTTNNGVVSITVKTNAPPDLSGYATTGAVAAFSASVNSNTARIATLEANKPAKSQSFKERICAPIQLNSVSVASPPVGISVGYRSAGYRYDSLNDYSVWILPKNTTNVTAHCFFGPVDAANTNMGVRFSISSEYYNSLSGRGVMSAIYDLLATDTASGFTGTGTNTMFKVSVPITAASYTSDFSYIAFLTSTGGVVGTYTTNYFYIMAVECDVMTTLQ